MSERWDHKFMGLARHVATWSKDRSRGIGCVIVGPDYEIRATGYNGFPRGVDDEIEARHERPAKYDWTEHAERNAIYNAARVGSPLYGCSLYATLFPCMGCARAIVQAGINTVCAPEPNLDDPVWGKEFKNAQILLDEAGVYVDYYEEPVGKEAPGAPAMIS
jgi:dCMP deaminase